MQQFSPGVSYQTLFSEVLARIHVQFAEQTPQLQGEGDREVFGVTNVEPVHAIDVLRIDAQGQLEINAGETHGLRVGVSLTIYPPRTTDFSNPDTRLARVQLTKVDAASAWAKIAERFGDAPIEPGSRAVLSDPGSSRLRRNVHLFKRDDLPAGIDQDTALTAAKTAIQNDPKSFVGLDETKTADFQVVVNDQSEYEIWDPAGALIRLRPPVRIDAQNSAGLVTARLTHLTKYRNVQELSNRDPQSPLAHKLEVKLAGLPADFNPTQDKPEPQALKTSGGTPTFNMDDWLCLCIRNASSEVLNITVLDLQPDWGITQILPSGQGAAFESLDPGETRTIPMQAWLPEGFDQGTDIVKVFATAGNATTNFHWLELNALDQGLRNISATKRSATPNPLEDLLESVALNTRQLTAVQQPASARWTAAQVEVHVKQ